MKKIVALILLMCMVLTFAACAGNVSTTSANTTSANTTSANTTSTNTTATNTTAASTTAASTTAASTTPGSTMPEISLQEVYDAGKSLEALLGDHENVYVLITSGGNVIREEYFSKQFSYSFYGTEFMDLGFEYSSFVTEHSEYIYFDSIYAFNVTIKPSGMADFKDRFSTIGMNGFISSTMFNDNTTIVEKDGAIIVTCTADPEEIVIIGEDVVSCTETYTLDAKTLEMTSIKTVYTYKDGSVEEGIVTITRDVEAPEGAKPFIAYDQETENLSTVTIVSNPGTENEKTDSIKVAKDLYLSLSPDWDVEEEFNVYADADCTQSIEEALYTNSDITVYIKWGE